MQDQPELPAHNGREMTVRNNGGEPTLPARMQYAGPVEADFLDDAGESSLLEYWHVLRRHKGTVVIFAFLGALAGLLVSLPQTLFYEARTSLEIESLNENFLDLASVNPTSPSGSNSAKLEISTQIKILESRALLEKVVDKMKLAERPEFRYESGRLSAWRKALGLPPATTLTPREQALEIAAGSYTAQPSRGTRVVEIISEWPDPRLAADFANTLAETFTEHNLMARWEASQRTGDWLSRQLEDLRIELEKSEEKLQQYARATGLLFTAEKESVAEEKLRQLQAEISKAQADRITKQSRFELAKTSAPESLSEILDHGPLRAYQVKRTDLRRELAELRSTYTPAHYKVKRVQAQIQEFEATMGKERSNIIERVGTEYQSALRREKKLSAAYAPQAKLVSQQAGKAIQYNILKREVDTSRQLYDNLLRKVKEASVASAMSASNIRVFDPATPPRFPSKPNHLLNVALGCQGRSKFGPLRRSKSRPVGEGVAVFVGRLERSPRTNLTTSSEAWRRRWPVSVRTRTSSSAWETPTGKERANISVGIERADNSTNSTTRCSLKGYHLAWHIVLSRDHRAPVRNCLVSCLVVALGQAAGDNIRLKPKHQLVPPGVFCVIEGYHTSAQGIFRPLPRRTLTPKQSSGDHLLASSSLGHSPPAQQDGASRCPALGPLFLGYESHGSVRREFLMVLMASIHPLPQP